MMLLRCVCVCVVFDLLVTFELCEERRAGIEKVEGVGL